MRLFLRYYYRFLWRFLVHSAFADILIILVFCRHHLYILVHARYPSVEITITKLISLLSDSKYLILTNIWAAGGLFLRNPGRLLDHQRGGCRHIVGYQ